MMTPDNMKRLQKVCSIVTAVLIGILAVGLIVGCLSIKQLGEKPFNLENVGAALGYLAVPGVLLLICVIFSMILDAVSPKQKAKAKATREKNGKKPKDLSPSRLKNVRILIFGIAIGLIILGIMEKGYLDVLNKAIRICQECIGIG